MNKWWYVVIVLFLIYLVGMIFAVVVFSNGSEFGDRIVIVPLEGAITTNGGSTSVFSSSGISSTRTVEIIKRLNDDNSVKGIIFAVNSPGGTVVASQEIGDVILKLGKPSYAVIREVGASGGYWIASANDKIIVNPMSITGSIGVIGSYLNFAELFDEYGIKYEQFTGGEFKDLGSPYRNMSLRERDLLQSKIDNIHEYFILEIAKNRNMSVESVRKVADGQFYLGQEALALGLVDELGDIDKAVLLMREELNITDIAVVIEEKKISLLDIISSNIAYKFGEGFANTLVKYDLDNRFVIRA